jgi:hypothetical protein
MLTTLMGYGLDPAGKFAARNQHPPFTGQAFQADIRAQTNDLPLIPAAWVRFAQSHDIIDA